MRADQIQLQQALQSGAPVIGVTTQLVALVAQSGHSGLFDLETTTSGRGIIVSALRIYGTGSGQFQLHARENLGAGSAANDDPLRIATTPDRPASDHTARVGSDGQALAGNQNVTIIEEGIVPSEGIVDLVCAPLFLPANSPIAITVNPDADASYAVSAVIVDVET